MINNTTKKDMFLSNLKSGQTIKVGQYEFSFIEDNSFFIGYAVKTPILLNLLGSYSNLLNWIKKQDNLRICTECGMPMDEGWIYEDALEYFCTEECYIADANRTWGEGNWKITDYENEEGGYLEFLDENDGQWEALDFYWTEWWS